MSDQPGSPKRPILVVDDDQRIRPTIRWILEDEGFEVAEARDVREALAVAALVSPCMVPLDYMLPDGNGGDVVRGLRAAAVAPRSSC